MPWSGAGAFTRTDGTRSGADVAAQQKAANVKVRADMHDNEMEDFATGLELCVARDGQNAASANLPMGGFKHSNVAATSGAASRSEYTSGGTVQDGAIQDAGDTAGTTTAYTATLSPAITAYANKQLFRVKFNATCGATPTINFNSVGAKKMYRLVGTTATQITTGELSQNFVALLRYDTALDGAAGAFWVMNFPAPAEAAASETVAGVAELATQAETNAGTSDTTTVTPLKLHTKPGQVMQVVNTATGAVATGTTATPVDDTIPQITEGDQFMSLAITPKNTNNLLKIDITVVVANSGSSNAMTLALHQDATANALASWVHYMGAAGETATITATHYMTAGTTSATTFRARLGAGGASTTTFNGQGGARLHGGSLKSSITITEYVA